LNLAQDLLVEVFTVEMPGGVAEASEVQATLAATQARDLNLPLDDTNIKVRTGSLALAMCTLAVGAPAKLLCKPLAGPPTAPK
jgi:hypothetical protein